ncbi:hypothetical protein BGZ70_007776 [Mortierella alpina]|uniref:Uncharacterized protein n=1 Tax=Mortierella alpina TaxID=64518 RepID=A0A9P6J5N1_MORAP|nr:hypothetical protein BGZ70_007776 [Mortierella alpina]
MRGRLPETKAVRANPQEHFSHGDTPLTAQRVLPSLEPSEEEIEIQAHIQHVQDEIQRTMSAPITRVIPYRLSHREHAALAGIAGIVQQDMQTLQSGLVRAGRPPDQRDGEYTPAPDWDTDYITALVEEWQEPVFLESDYYVLRSMCLYELAMSVQVKMLGPEKVRKYFSMALALAQKGHTILRTTLRQEGGEDRHWRYQMLISYIFQQQDADQLATRALRSFYQGIKHHPNQPKTTAEPSLDLEWSKMATIAESYVRLQNDFHSRQTWTQHIVQLLNGATRENKKTCGLHLTRISRTYLEYAFWIREQPQALLVTLSKPRSMSQEMRQASVAALIYAKKAMESIKEEDLHPEHFCQIIDCVYMMSLVCVRPNLIDSYSREASFWIDQLQSKFPHHQVNPSYRHSAKLISSKDAAMRVILEQRQAPQKQLIQSKE